MQKIGVLICLWLSLFVSACQSEQIDLSEQKLNQYIVVVSEIKNQHLEKLKLSTPAERDKFEQTVKKAGFDDLDAFLETHTEISWALAQNKSKTIYTDLKQSVQGGLDSLDQNFKLDLDLKQQGQKWWQSFTSETKELSAGSQKVLEQNLDKLKQALN